MVGVSFGVGVGINRTRPALHARRNLNPPVPGYLGPVASRNILPNNFFAGHLQARSRSAHWSREPLTSVKLLLPNWYLDGSGNKVNSGQPQTVRASIEYPANTFAQVKFGGAVSGSIPAGQNLESDFTTVNIPAGAQFWVRLWVENAGGIAWTALTAFKSVAGFGEAFGSAASGITDLTMTAGAVPDAGNASNFMGPLAILGMTEAKTVIYFGDSIAAGLNDTNDASGDFGIFRYLSANHGYINASRSSDRAQWAAARDAVYFGLAQYCSHAIVQHSINDIVAARSYAQITADLITVGNAIKAVNPDIWLMVSTLTPDTDAGNTAASPATSTARYAVNAWKRGIPAPFNDVVDLALTFDTNANDLWDTTAHTADGRHISPTGNLFPIGHWAVSQTLLNTQFVPSPPMQTLFDQTTVIGMTKAADTADYMMGVQMQFAVDGYIDRVSIWKPAGSSITLSRLGGVWDAAGTTKLRSGQLATASEPAEPAWVHMPLDTPLAVTAGTVYKLGIRVPDGSYSAQSGGLTSAIVRGDLTAPASAGVSPGNGIFAAGSSDVVPNQTFGSANYYVDTGFHQGTIPTMPPAGYPDASNTGPTGTLSASGSMASSANGQIIENLDIAGSVTITHANVTLRNCKVSLHDDAGLIVNATGANVTIENCLIDGLAGSYVGIYVEAGGSITACEIRNFENGIVSAGGIGVYDTYIHSMTSTAAAPHYDCFECNGGSYVTLMHNTFICEQDQTSCVMLDNLYSGLSNITVDDNVLIGGGYTLYVDGHFGGGVVDNATISITNNKMVPGQYGYFAFTDTNPDAIGNVNAYSGLAF